jgi:hypothetical protein
MRVCNAVVVNPDRDHARLAIRIALCARYDSPICLKTRNFAEIPW